jgi:hypothetical protein
MIHPQSHAHRTLKRPRYLSTLSSSCLAQAPRNCNAIAQKKHTPRNTHYATPPTRPYHGSHLPSPTMSLNAISNQNPNPSIQSRPYYRSPTHPCLHMLYNQGYALFKRNTSSSINAQRSNIRLLENFRMPCPWLFAALLFRGVFCDARV